MNAIGEAQFAIHGRWREPGQGGGNDARIHHVSAHVDLADLANLRRGLGVFDDVDDLAGGVADDAAIGERMVHHGGEKRGVSLAQGVAIEQAANGARAEERRVAVENQQVAAEIGEQRNGLADGIAGTERTFLHHVVVLLAEVGPHVVLEAADDDVDVFGRDVFEGVLEHAFEDAALAERLEQDGISGGQHDGLQRMWGRLATCGRVALGLGGICTGPSATRPQDTILPHNDFAVRHARAEPLVL